MRSSARIAVGLLCLGPLCVGLAVGVRGTGGRGCSPAAALAAEWPVRQLTASGAPPAATPPFRRMELLPAPAKLKVAPNAVGTFVGVRDDLLVDPILAGKPVRVKLNRGGSSISFRVDFDTGARAAFKPDQTNTQTIPRKEIAAYRLNQLLGLNRVAPAVPMELRFGDLLGKLDPESAAYLPRINAEVLRGADGSVRGEAQYWIPVIKDPHIDTNDGIHRWWTWLTVGNDVPPGQASMAEQISTMLAFDFLTNNPDRFSGSNAMGDAAGTRLYYMDNTLSFMPEADGDKVCRKYLSLSEKYSRSLYRALHELTYARLHDAMAAAPQGPWPYLSEAEMRAVIARRDYLVDYIDGLIEVFGGQEVLAFP